MQLRNSQQKNQKNSCFIVLEKCTFATALERCSLKYLGEVPEWPKGAVC